MLDVLIQMAGLIACGSLWRLLRPLGLDAESSRPVLTGLVYVLLLPALVLVVLWRAPIGIEALWVALSAAGGLLAALLVTWLVYRPFTLPRPALGALLLAATFPNATYMGLPVLSTALGEWAEPVAIQYDLFACTPLLLSVGVLLARRFGSGGGEEHPLRTLLKVPPLWAAVAGTLLNLNGVPLPAGLEAWLERLAAGVIPLMLIALGMGLRWDSLHFRELPRLAPALAIRLLLIPLLVWGLAGLLGLEGGLRTAVTLEAAMPSMVLGIVLCDRYRLDTGLYAAAVTLSTALSLFTLPFWFRWAG